MDIETIFKILSLIGSSCDIYDKFHSPLEKARDRALSKWCKNKDIRKKFAASRFSSPETLKEYIKNPSSSLDKGTEEFLIIWEKELKKDENYGLILEMLQREGNDKLKEIKKLLLEDQHQKEKTLEGINDIKEAINIFTFRPVKYQKPSIYIPRTVKTYFTLDVVDFVDYHYNTEKYLPFPLIDLILNKQRRIQLFSEAQSGKTTEIQNLAAELEESELFSSYIFNLKDYTGKTHLLKQLDIKTLLNEKEVVLIFDGLDEVKDEWRESVSLEIKYLAEKYTHVYIIITCRLNYEKTNSVDGFQKVYLTDLSFDAAKQYITKVCKNGDELIMEIERKELYHLVYNPFYLSSLIKFYEEKGVILCSKTEIYDYVIDNSFAVDEKKYPQEVISLKTRSFPLLNKIAFCMQAGGEFELTEEMITQQVGIEIEDMQLCLKCTLFYKTPDATYTFVHNAFREYLVAKILQTFCFEKIMELVCYDGTEKIKPVWYNVITLLMGLVEENTTLFLSLRDWLTSTEKDLLLHCEKHLYDDKKATEIFIRIFNEYDNMFIGLREAKNFMQFANNRETILFLEKRFDIETTISKNACNILGLFEYADFNTLRIEERDRIENKLIQFLKNNLSEHERGYYLMTPFDNPYLKNEKTIDTIFHTILDTTNTQILNSFFDLLVSLSLTDKYAEWIIQKGRKYPDIIDNKQNYLLVRKEFFYNALASFNEIQNIINTIDLLLSDSMDYEDYKKSSEIIEKLFKKLMEKEEDVTLDLINQLKTIKPWKSHYIKGIYQLFRDYFFVKETDEMVFYDSYMAIKHILNTPEPDLYKIVENKNVLSVVLTNERLESILSDRELSYEQKYRIAGNLKSYVSVYSNPIWVEKINDAFQATLSQFRNYNIIYQEGFNILFDKQKFRKKVEEFYHTYSSSSTILEDEERFDKEKINWSVREYFNILCREKDLTKITYNNLLEKLDSEEYFNTFFIKEVIFYSETIVASTDQKLIINNTVKEVLRYTINHQVLINTATLIKIYDLQIEEELILNLLPVGIFSVNDRGGNPWVSTSFENSILEFISQRVNNRKNLNTKLAQKIQNHTWGSPDEKYFALLEYVIKEKMSDSYDCFLGMLLNQTIYNSSKRTIIHYFLKLNQPGHRMIKAYIEDFSELTKLDYYHEVLNRRELNLSDCEVQEISNQLEVLYKKLPDHKDRILNLLIFTGNCWALKEYIKEIHTLSKREFPSLDRYKYDEIENICILFEYGLNKKGIDEPGSIGQRAKVKLQQFAMENKQQRDYVINFLHKLAMSDFNLRYLKQEATNIMNKYYEHNYKNPSLKECLQLYQSL